MALAIATVKKTQTAGNRYKLVGTVDFDSSYPTGGEPFAITGIERIDWLHATGIGAATGYNFSFDPAAQKLLAFRTDQVDDPEEEVPNTTDLSAITGVRFVGEGC